MSTWHELLADPLHYTHSTPIRYDGQFVQGSMEGEGTYSWPSGVKYVGEWKVRLCFVVVSSIPVRGDATVLTVFLALLTCNCLFLVCEFSQLIGGNSLLARRQLPFEGWQASRRGDHVLQGS
jgi:hypothetical protein